MFIPLTGLLVGMPLAALALFFGGYVCGRDSGVRAADRAQADEWRERAD